MSILIYFIAKDSSAIHPIRLSNQSTLANDIERIGVEFVRVRSGDERAADAFTKPETTGCYLTRSASETSESIVLVAHTVDLIKTSQMGGWFGGASTVTYEPQTSILGEIRSVHIGQLLATAPAIPAAPAPPRATTSINITPYADVLVDLKRFISKRNDELLNDV